MSSPPFGHRDNPATQQAPVDALLIAAQFWRDDDNTTPILLKHCDPWSVILQLTGWLRCAVRTALDHGAGAEFGDSDEYAVLDRWLAEIRNEQSEANP